MTNFDKVSAPTTNTFLYTPVSINCVAIAELYTKPEQAADKSNAAAFFAPNFSCKIQAVDGVLLSAEIVATIIISSSSAETLASSNALCAAIKAKSDVACSGAQMRLSLIPVRSVIHSSLVSTNFSISALVRIFSGT